MMFNRSTDKISVLQRNFSDDDHMHLQESFQLVQTDQITQCFALPCVHLTDTRLCPYHGNQPLGTPTSRGSG